jgi:hypothetical protein
MAKGKTLSLEEKTYRALQGIFIAQAIQMKVANADMQKVLGCGRPEVDAVAKIINKALKKHGKET